MTVNATSGSSGQLPVTPIDGIKMSVGMAGINFITFAEQIITFSKDYLSRSV